MIFCPISERERSLDSVDPQNAGQYVSFILHIEDDHDDVEFNGKVVMADGRRVELANGSYLVRVWVDREAEMIRGTIRHEGTGRKIHFQTGDRVGEFVRTCLIKGDMWSD